MIRTATLIAALVFAAPVAAQTTETDAPAGPALKREATVTGEIVRIGDLIENAGVVAEVPIFRAPDLGHTGSVPAVRVLDAVRRHHIIWVNTRGLDEVLVTRASRAIDGKEIEARLIRALAGQSGPAEAKNLTASFDNEVRTFHIEPNAELGIARLAFDQRTRRFEAVFDLPSGASRRPVLRVTGTLIETAEAVVALRAIAAGEVVAGADVMVERRPKTDAIAIEDVLGFAAKRPLKAGQVIRAADVMKPELIGRNETVTISYEVPGLVLSVRGKALEAGAKGDVINVLNIQSKRTIQATVSGPGRVTVSVAAPRLASNGNGPSNPR
jgi:flagellar basal body P-ring formation protein FlgA